MGSHKAVTRADAHAPGEVADYLDFAEVAAPATPATGFVRVYPKTDGKLYIKDDAGTETDLTAGGSSGAMTRISQYVESGGGSATISFTSIAGTYETLVIELVGRSSGGNGIGIQFNSDTGTNYDWQRTGAGNGATAINSESIGASSARGGAIATTSHAAGDPGQQTIKIPGYARTTFQKRIYTAGGYPTNTAEYFVESSTSLWKNTAAITRIDLFPSSGNFIDGTVATLYGIT